MNEPRWVVCQRLLSELESFLYCERGQLAYGKDIYWTFTKALILLLEEQHERDPTVPPDAR